MVAAWQAVANVSLAAGKELWDPRLLWLTLALVAIILLGAAVIFWLDRWRKSAEADPLNASDQLAYFQELYEQGELSQKEFERIRARLLAQQLQQRTDLPALPCEETTRKQPESDAFAPGPPPRPNEQRPREKEADPGSSLP